MWIFLQVVEKYFLETEIRDMDGAATGLFSKGIATVSLDDINDNPPTFRETAVSADIIFFAVSVGYKIRLPC